MPPLSRWPLVAVLLALASPAALASAETTDQPRTDEMSRFMAEQRQAVAGFDEQFAGAFARYKDARDQEFLKVLENQWQAFEESAGLVRDRAPKPVVLPKATPRPLDADIPDGTPLAAVPAVKTPPPEPLPPPTPVPRPAEIPPGPRVTIDFYQRTLTLPHDSAGRSRLGGKIDKEAIGRFWQEQSSTDFAPLVARLADLRRELDLNDWAYFQLVLATAEAMEPKGNEATLQGWFLLTKSGYRTRIGYSDNRVYLLAAARSTIYQVPYYTLEGTRYFNLSFHRDGHKPGTLYTYETDYPGADRPLSLALDTTPRTGESIAVRELHFSYDGTTHTLPVRYNRNSVAFCNSYPQTDFPVFFDARVPTVTEDSLIAALAPLVAGRSQVEAVNILLRFVQTAFDYQTDDAQFGREKYMFVEETLSFAHSDCEDRAILFSFLVRRLTGLEVVGLHYPGHLATAVAFDGKVPGDGISVGGRRFVVCDPTYIHANVGMTMPQFKTTTPEVILVGQPLPRS